MYLYPLNLKNFGQNLTISQFILVVSLFNLEYLDIFSIQNH